MKYKLGSLFDGSGGFPLAGGLCGIEATWASEIEPYPIAVTKTRIPNMKHLGDISKIDGSAIEPVDIITFGSPCQDLSVAGRRAGLKHEANGDDETTRSGLFMEAVRIIKEMRRATHGKYPRFALWENVPGAFSSNKGEDFRVVLEELIKIAEPSAAMPPVPKNGWPYADSYVGDGWSLAYRVFDAQYWGVPQRRRRIHLVADFRGECARTVLFEREGVRGYFEASGKPWQGSPPDAQGCSGADDRTRKGFDGYNGTITGDQSSTIGVNCGMSTGRNGVIEVHEHDAVSFHLTQDPIVGERVTPCISSGNPNRGQATIGVAYETKNHFMEAYQHHGWRESDKAGTLTAGQNDSVRGDTPLVISSEAKEARPAYCLQGNMIGRADKNGPQGDGINENSAFTLNTIDRHAVVYQETIGSLCARDYKGVGNQYVTEDKLVIHPIARYIVRRLTPTECARLQGFGIILDRWGDIEQKTDLTEDEYRFWLEVRNTHAIINGKEAKDYTKKQMLTWYSKLHIDAAEYKMWGNGIALPPAIYCMQGMREALDAETLEHEKEVDVTDLSDIPTEIKEEIIRNDEILRSQNAESETTEEETMETKINTEPATITENVIGFDAVEQLKRLADERKALANLRPENTRFTDDVRAIEYAVSVLEAVGL